MPFIHIDPNMNRHGSDEHPSKEDQKYTRGIVLAILSCTTLEVTLLSQMVFTVSICVVQHVL